MAVKFRRANRADLEAVVKLLCDDELGAQREDAASPPSESYVLGLEAIEADKNQLLAIADDQGSIVGCMQISFIPGISRMGMWRAQIEGVRIARDYRGEGLGRKFFEWAIMESRARNCGLVQLTTDQARTDAQRFYESLGFVSSHIGMKLSL